MRNQCTLPRIGLQRPSLELGLGRELNVGHPVGLSPQSQAQCTAQALEPSPKEPSEASCVFVSLSLFLITAWAELTTGSRLWCTHLQLITHLWLITLSLLIAGLLSKARQCKSQLRDFLSFFVLFWL